MDKFAKQLVKIFLDRRIDQKSVRMLAFWVVHEAGPALDTIRLFCHHIEREIELHKERGY